MDMNTLNVLFTKLWEKRVAPLNIGNFVTAIAVALVLGAFISLVYQRCARAGSRGFAVTLAIIPAMVSVVIMMISGSLGASVAVAGAFRLVRFRSAQGTAMEISSLFLAMAVGLACGSGYVAFAALFAVLLCAVLLFYTKIGFGSTKHSLTRMLRITVPEDLDYTGMFSDLFAKYTKYSELESIKTTDLGSLNRLTYVVTLKQENTEKAFIDELRERNGNLEIMMGSTLTNTRSL